MTRVFCFKKYQGEVILDKKDFNSAFKERVMGIHDLLVSYGNELYELYTNDPERASYSFLKALLAQHDGIIGIARQKNLHSGSISGIIKEWLFYYLIAAAINHEKDKNFQAHHNYAIPFRWKGKKKHPTVNADIALVSLKPKRLIYCLEIKTNFEDGFQKYYQEQNLIYHHRIKTYPEFKYHYITFSEPPGIIRKFLRQVNTLKRRSELWIFPFDKIRSDELRGKLALQAEELLHLLFNPISQRLEKEEHKGYLIEWMRVDSVDDFGHGVRLHYCKKREDITRDNMIAFIDGFGWYHGDSHKVRIYILTSNSMLWGKIGIQDKTASRIKDVARRIVGDRKLSPGVLVDDSIMCWVNG
jgi:hypothetical protein